MNRYQTYAQATSRLCSSAFGGSEDLTRFKDRIRRLYNKISKSQLTVYQKERLLQQLQYTREITTLGHASSALLAARFGKNSAAAESHKGELLAA